MRLTVSASATRTLAECAEPPVAEMELLFSCLIPKWVRFPGLGAVAGATRVTERLYVRFRAVMARACAVSDVGATPPLDDFPIADARPYLPRWLAIDFRRGEWSGEFGY